MAVEDDYVDDLELLEQYDLEASDSDASSVDSRSSSSARRQRRSARASDAESDDERQGELDDGERTEQLKAPILAICSALGGYEEEEDQHGRIRTIYKLGDDCLACLRDLRRLWRQDDTDPSRAIARVFAQVNVLHNDLVPILLRTAGKGGKNDKVALACTDLLTAMTWPIDAMAEIHDAVTKDEDTQHVLNLPQLEKAQVQYKSSILRLRAADGNEPQRDVLSVVLRHIMLPALSKPRIDRTEKDVGIVSMCLHLYRNLLTIRDPIATTLSSTDVLANANLQSLLICAMDKAHVLDTLLMLASSADTREFNQWNAVTSECIYQIFVGTSPKALCDPSRRADGLGDDATMSDSVTQAASSALSSSLAAEAKEKRAAILASGATRHSRFGTTINFVGPDGHRRMARSQAALKKSVAQLTEENLAKAKRKAKRRKAAREVGAPKLKASWTPQAAVLLHSWADRFMQTGFETLTRSVLQDIRSERDKMGDLDLARIRVMQLGTFFLEYFLLRKSASEDKHSARASTSSKGKERAIDGEPAAAAANADKSPSDDQEWPFSYVAGWLEPWSFKMVLVRSVEAQESRSWLEFVSAVQLWTILLRLVDKMSRSRKEDEREVADGLQAQLYYLSETLDACHTIVRAYTKQSFACLDAILTFAHIMPKMLERYSSNREHMYVRARKQVRKSRQTGELDEQESEAAQIREHTNETQTEREFRFNDFQKKLATRQLAGACIMYLLRWKEFTEPEEQLGKVVAVMHRIAIKAGDYRQFFIGDCRAAFRSLLTGPALTALEPKAAGPVKDLRKFMDYVLRKFSKMDMEEQLLYDQGKRAPKLVKEPKVPAEIKVRDGKSYAEQIGIAVGLLLQKEKMEAVLWVKSGLEMASAHRAEILLSERAAEERQRADTSEDAATDGVEKPPQADSNETAADKIQAYELKYDFKEEVRLDASILPELKLLCRLVGLESNEDDKLHWRWLVPARLLPAQLDERVSLIEDFIRTPYRPDQGIELSKLVQRKLKPRAGTTVATATPSGDDSDDDSDSSSSLDENGNKKMKPKRKRSKRMPAGPKTRRAPMQKKWTGENFIDDSDEEFAFAAALGMQHDDDDACDDGGRGGNRRDGSSPSGDSVGEGRARQPDTPPTSVGFDASDGGDDGHLDTAQARTKKKEQSLKALRQRRKALFLGLGGDGDDEDDDDEVMAEDEPQEEEAADENISATVKARTSTSDSPMTAKRRLFLNNDGDAEDDADLTMSRTVEDPEAMAATATQTQTQTKRRRIVVDSDEEDA
ncbi:Topoisomerase 1-associated factor 1 [Thecaphora frezii]